MAEKERVDQEEFHGCWLVSQGREDKHAAGLDFSV